MTKKEIDFLKNITIEDVEKFYPEVIDDDFQMMKVIIDYGVLQRPDDFPNLIQCLIYVLEETSKTVLEEARGMKSIYRNMLIDKILEK
jgi:hypothetical protein